MELPDSAGGSLLRRLAGVFFRRLPRLLRLHAWPRLFSLPPSASDLDLEAQQSRIDGLILRIRDLEEQLQKERDDAKAAAKNHKVDLDAANYEIGLIAKMLERHQNRITADTAEAIRRKIINAMPGDST